MLDLLKILELLFFCSCKNWHPVGGLWDANDDCCERRLEKYMTVRKIHVRVLYTMLKATFGNMCVAWVRLKGWD